MTTATINSTESPDAEVVSHLVAALDRDTNALGKDDVSRCVRAGVKALRTSIESEPGTVAASLSALETTVDRLHMSHMRPFFKQTLRTLRTALNMDVHYTMKPQTYDHPRRDYTNGSIRQGQR
jgi:hypothetical protein